MDSATETAPRRRRHVRRGLASSPWVLATILLLATTGAAAAVVRAVVPNSTGDSTLAFTWSMPDRTGLDADHDGLIDYDQTPAYLNPSSWTVNLDVCSSTAWTGRSSGAF